jgi:3-deoxy-D-manno-octulosonic-acid transferase
MHFLYSLLTAAGVLVLLPYFLWVGARQGKYFSSLRQRLGFRLDELRAAAAPGGAVWIHAVSVGEVLAGLPLGERLRQRCPGRRIVLSTTTLTGQRVARERARFADAVFYFPFDWRGPVRRAVGAARPAAVVILETEIWPNFLRECRRAGVPVIFANGRISEKSFRRYRGLFDYLGALGGFLARVLSDAELFLMQSPADAARLLELGAPPERVEVCGNLKYDLEPPPESPVVSWLERQLAAAGRRPLAVAGSIAADEEHAVLAGFDLLRRAAPGALLVLAPRKPERFEAAARIARERGWRVVRRSTVDLGSVLDLGTALDPHAEVLLLDSVGELAALYRLADVAFVGGSLVPAGGHNILEPALFGVAPVFGPSMENFRQAATEFLGVEAAIQVASGEELGRAWIELTADAERRARMGAAACALVERNRGATARSLERIVAVLDGRGVAA